MYVGFGFHFEFSILIKQIHQYIRLHIHGCQVWHFISAQEEKGGKGGMREEERKGKMDVYQYRLETLNKLLLL